MPFTTHMRQPDPSVRADLDLNPYPTEIKLTDQQKKFIPITRHDFHGDWNYTMHLPNE